MIISTDDGTLLALALALAVINWELVDVVDITIIIMQIIINY